MVIQLKEINGVFTRKRIGWGWRVFKGEMTRFTFYTDEFFNEKEITAEELRNQHIEEIEYEDLDLSFQGSPTNFDFEYIVEELEATKRGDITKSGKLTVIPKKAIKRIVR